MPRGPSAGMGKWFVAVFDEELRRVLEIVPWHRWVHRDLSDPARTNSKLIEDAIDELDAYVKASKQLEAYHTQE